MFANSPSSPAEIFVNLSSDRRSRGPPYELWGPSTPKFPRNSDTIFDSGRAEPAVTSTEESEFLVCTCTSLFSVLI